MSTSGVSLPPSTQSSVAALANTEKLLGQSEKSLASGKSVNDAQDNPVVYYEAQSFLQQAGDLSNLKNSVSTALTTVTSTTSSIDSVSRVVDQLKGITAQAAATTDTSTRAGLANQYNSLLTQLDNIAKDSTFNGTNLLNGSANSLTVNFNPNNTSSLTIQGVDATSNGLGLTPITNGFTNADINAANTQLQTAQSTLNTSAATFGSNATLIQINQDFTSQKISNLQNASDNLTGADLTTQVANLLAEQTQNQLGVSAVGISGKASQAILKLLA